MSLGVYKLNDKCFPALENKQDWEKAKSEGVEVESLDFNGNFLCVVYKMNDELCSCRYDVQMNGPVALEEVE